MLSKDKHMDIRAHAHTHKYRHALIVGHTQQTHTNTQQRRNTYNMQVCTKKHSSMYMGTHTHCYTEQQTLAHGWALLPNITSPIGGYSTLAVQPFLSVKYATWWSTLTFSFEGKDEYAWSCWQKKTHGTQSLALLDMVHSQEREQADFNIRSGFLVSTQSSLRPTYSNTLEKARGGGNGHLNQPRWRTAGRKWLVLTLYPFSSIFVYTHVRISSVHLPRW